MNINSVWSLLSNNSSNVIAICAFIATFWQAYLSRKHNRLSVKPQLEISSGFNFNDQEYYINILNNGLGTALITKIQLVIDGEEIDTQISEAFDEVVSELFHLYEYKQDHLIISDTYMMKPNEEK